MASTATATPRVAGDIVRRLSLRDPVRIATGFDRPNLSFAVARPATAMVEVSRLIDPDMLVEIEADAILGGGRSQA